MLKITALLAASLCSSLLILFPTLDWAKGLIETKRAAEVQTEGSLAVLAQKGRLPVIHTIGPAHVFTLTNGLQIVVLPNHRAPVVTQMIWYRAGSADEPQGRTGIAHFLEHLMFKGTEKYPNGEFSKFVSRIGGEVNAFTAYDYTVYYQSITPDYLGDIMLRESDRMENLILNDHVVDLERQVILEERRMRIENDPEAMLSEESRAVLYLNSPYRHPIIGWRQEMEELTREDALSFYNQFYMPDNAVVIIAGDVTPEKVRELAISSYGNIKKKRSEKLERIRPQEPVSDPFREVTRRDPRVTQGRYKQYWIVPSYHKAQPGEAEALKLLGEILGGDLHGRLEKKLVVERGIAASVGAGYRGVTLDDGIFYVYGMPRGKAELEEVRLAVNTEIMDIIRNGIDQAEVERARNRLAKAMIFALDNPVGLAQLYGAALSSGQTIEDINAWQDRLQAITPVDIKNVAERYLIPERGVVSRLLPASDGVSDKNAQESAKKIREH
ncbi:MAG: zinc protease [Candidatus Tokpelaia sp. JSC085]|nr:MAG: zinc protease [Candidatus Tokpelaia sp. JSC085]